MQSYYKIGPFRISISFDDNELGKKVTEKLAYVCPAALGYETILEGIEDCKCSIFINKIYQKKIPESGYRIIKENNYHLVYSPDLHSVEVFLGKRVDSFHYIFRYLWNLMLFVPFFLKHNAVMLHAAGVSYKSKGFIFIGSSGIGKTTMCRILTQAETRILSDERILVYNKNSIASDVYPLWVFSQGGKDLSVAPKGSRIPLKAAFFLRQSNKFAVKELGLWDRIRELYQHSILSYPGALWLQEDFFSTICSIARNTAIFQLSYDRSDKIFSIMDAL